MLVVAKISSRQMINEQLIHDQSRNYTYYVPVWHDCKKSFNYRALVEQLLPYRILTKKLFSILSDWKVTVNSALNSGFIKYEQ